MAAGTVGLRLRFWSHQDGEKPAFIFRGTLPGNHRLVLTRRDVYELASVFCNMLQEEEIEAGQVVFNTLPNSPERLITDLGCMLAGVATLNGMMFLADGEDLVKCLTWGSCAALVVDPTKTPNILHVLGDRVIVRGDNARSRLVPELKKVFNVDCGGGAGLRPWLDNLKSKQHQKCHPAPVKPQDVAIIFNTPGSLAFSRLVSKTHQQFIQMGEVLYNLMDLGPEDLVFNNRSLGWHNGTCCDYVVGGSTRVLVDMTVPPEDPLEFAWEACQAEHCAVCFMLPPAISASLSWPDLWSGKKHKPRTIVSGFMPMSKQQVLAAGVLCGEMVIVQGSAETGFLTHRRLTNADSDHYEDGDFGLPAGDYRLRLLTAQGEVIPSSEVGRPGQVQVKGGQMSPVKGDDVTTVTEDGWMTTGDVALYNARHTLQTVCRNRYAFMHGPYLIYPRWLERKIEDCPGVTKVIIVPVPDSRMFQEMCCFVVPERGQVLKDADIRSFCQTLFVNCPLECQHIPRYFLVIPEIPIQMEQTSLDREKLFFTALQSLGLCLHTL